MATRWGCLGAGNVASDFFTAIKENLPVEEHEVKLCKKEIGVDVSDGTVSQYMVTLFFQ